MTTYSLIVIGCSLGGLAAMKVILSALGDNHSVPVVLVQHRDKNPGLMLSSMLQRHTKLKVQEADDRVRIEPGNLYLAPAGYHLLVDDNVLSLSTEPPVRYAMPSIDVTFETAARSYGSGLIAVILTSSSVDGAEGAAMVEKRGGLLIVQDPLTAENATLPKAAIAATKNPLLVPLDQIGSTLGRICSAKGGANVGRSH